MKILVTGSSGQVGSHLVEYFSREHEVFGIDNRPCPFPETERHTEVVDIFRARDLAAHVRDADWVIHAAAQVSVDRSMKDPISDAENNVLGTVNLLWNSFLHEARYLLYISSAAVYGNPVRVPLDESHPTEPLSPYGTSKLCGEKYTLAFAAAYGMSTVIIRPFNIYSERADPSSPYSGVITKFTEWAKAGNPLLIEGDGKQTRDFVHISDVIRMVDLVIKKSNVSVGKIFNCGAGKERTILDLADIVRAQSGKDLAIRHVAPRQGDIRNSCADIGLAEKLLGYYPKKDLEAGIDEMMG